MSPPGPSRGFAGPPALGGLLPRPLGPSSPWWAEGLSQGTEARTQVGWGLGAGGQVMPSPAAAQPGGKAWEAGLQMGLRRFTPKRCELG